MAVRTFLSDRGDAGQRLDLVLRRHLADLESATRTRVQTWIDGGTVSINGQAVRRVATRVAAGDVLTVQIPDVALPASRPIEPDPTPLDILFEDSFLMAVNKPAGMVVHPTHAQPAGTLLNLLMWCQRGWPADMISTAPVASTNASATSRMTNASRNRPKAPDRVERPPSLVTD